ncbi:hypothetical protein GCM10011581_41650 [Saccharopolyspora subtropica]|uniref:Squalene cyclase C-terminal domain-containing protein n=2 Tax=Saccharopolyspora thermophila TaxID=89367 RepID=A0A917K402_9PSEU|nr:hypothetical protein GCM10011581_41650 [Saccharopolyspora subtropica]
MQALLNDLAANRSAPFSPSVYETAQYLRVSGRRAVARSQIGYLLAQQRRDGLWGADGFELIPTLSAIAGLASVPDSGPEVADALARASRQLWELALGEGGLPPLPDTVASELIAPSLVEAAGDVLRRHCPVESDGDGPVFPQPPRARPEFWASLRGLVDRGAKIPQKIWHSLEVFHPLPAEFARSVSPAPDGAVCCSPAATAAWASAVGPAAARGSLPYLDEVETRHSGAIPMGTSMPYFELLWIVNLALKYFPQNPVPQALWDELTNAFGQSGIGGGPGLPPDGDDTAYALLAFEKSGRRTDPQVLLQFWEEDHFVSYGAEQTPSETTNAHAIEYLNHVAAHRGDDAFAPVVASCAEWLVAQQKADGCWYDKWHISPYYATAACVEALVGVRQPSGPVRDAIRLARDWLLGSQSLDGGWGVGEVSSEETAYGVLALDCLVANAPDGDDEAAKKAITLAKGFLAGAEPAPALWMGKDLYKPYRLVTAVELCGRAVASRY